MDRFVQCGSRCSSPKCCSAQRTQKFQPLNFGKSQDAVGSGQHLLTQLLRSSKSFKVFLVIKHGLLENPPLYRFSHRKRISIEDFQIFQWKFSYFFFVAISMVPLVPSHHLPVAQLHIAPSRQPSLDSPSHSSPSASVPWVLNVVVAWAARAAASTTSIQTLLSRWFRAWLRALAAPLVALEEWRLAPMAWVQLEVPMASLAWCVLAWLGSPATLALASQLA